MVVSTVRPIITLLGQVAHFAINYRSTRDSMSFAALTLLQWETFMRIVSDHTSITPARSTLVTDRDRLMMDRRTDGRVIALRANKTKMYGLPLVKVTYS